MELHADHDDLIRAMKAKHDFPGFFPIVMFAKSDLAFTARLHAALEYIQDGAPFEISKRESTHKTYISYSVQIHVSSAEEALERRAFLGKLDGVITTL